MKEGVINVKSVCGVKRYSVNAGYKDLGRALARRGWVESAPNDRLIRIGSGIKDEGLDL